jgi:hypothetical protein
MRSAGVGQKQLNSALFAKHFFRFRRPTAILNNASLNAISSLDYPYKFANKNLITSQHDSGNVAIGCRQVICTFAVGRRVMKLQINFKSLEWWYWFVTLIAMIIGFLGMVQGFYGVIFVSVVQTVHFSVSRGFTAFPTQVRFVYGLFTIAALFDPTRILYWVLLIGTIMVVLFNRCFIATVLKLMPCNRNETLL